MIQIDELDQSDGFGDRTICRQTLLDGGPFAPRVYSLRQAKR